MARALVKTSTKARVQPEQIECRNQPMQSVLLPSTYDSLGVDRQMHQYFMLHTSRGSLHARSPECGCIRGRYTLGCTCHYVGFQVREGVPPRRAEATNYNRKTHMSSERLGAEASPSIELLRSLLSLVYISSDIPSTSRSSRITRKRDRRSKSLYKIIQEFTSILLLYPTMKLSLWMIAASFAASSMALPSRLEIGTSPVVAFSLPF